MHGYIDRAITDTIRSDLRIFPAVALLGPRQCGKSRLAARLAESFHDAVILDLENPRDRTRLSDPQLYFEANAERLICIDEIQLVPDLFPVLRTEIDRDRRPGRFLILGSASRELVNRSSESLAGRIGYRELTPFLPTEFLSGNPPAILESLCRGGFPESAMASDGTTSYRWREAFLRSIVERDLPLLGSRIPTLAMERFLTMCAHLQGQLLNTAKMGASLELTGPAVRTRLEFLTEALFIRLLPSWEGNLKKRLVKAPKLYFRDTGLCHVLLGIESPNDMLGHPAFGSSWESLCVETICSSMPGWNPSFYRTSNGAELDLILERGARRLAFEFKASSAPSLGRGLYSALEDLAPERCYVIGLLDDEYPVARNVTVCGLRECIRIIQGKAV